jgi:RimJ/RimL family protein N-acetyltransferase
MPWELTDDLDTFRAATDAFLAARPVPNTTLLTLVETLTRRGSHAYGQEAPMFGAWRDPDGVVAGALLQTPPFPVYFSSLPPSAVSDAVSAFAGRALSGVNLPVDVLDLFVGPWEAQAGVTSTVHMRTRLYRLESLTAPKSAGVVRPGRPDDRATLIGWMREFLDEIGEPGQDGVEGIVDDKLAAGLVTVGEDQGVPVTMVMRTAPASGVVRIQYVYTPPPFRGQGYAGTATAAACVSAGDSEVVLFTDLGNPTSNALYQRLGFRAVEDRTAVTFA